MEIDGQWGVGKLFEYSRLNDDWFIGSTGPTEWKAEDLTSQSFLLKKICRHSAKSHYEGRRRKRPLANWRSGGLILALSYLRWVQRKFAAGFELSMVEFFRTQLQDLTKPGTSYIHTLAPSRPFDFTRSEIWAVHMCRAQQNYFCPRTLELTEVCEWEHALPAKAGRVGSATCTSGVSWRNRHRHCPLNEPRWWKKCMKGWSCWRWFEGAAFGVVDVFLLLPKLRQKFLEREAIAYRERDKEHAVFCNEMHARVFPRRNRFRIGRILVRYWTHSCPLL